jgi:phosphoribosyl 1,2-cyclic phosphodiesterase
VRFCSLGSGSTGNATIVEAGGCAAEPRADRLAASRCASSTSASPWPGLTASDLDAIFVTHEHGDHIGSAVALARRNELPLWTSRGTWRAVREPELPVPVRYARDGEVVAIGALRLHPFTVAHDAEEPLQLRCSDGVRQIGVLTDAGSITAHLVDNLQRCDALLLECNHDRAMLSASRYPASLKARIGGRYGHLANDTAAEISRPACTTACAIWWRAPESREQPPELVRKRWPSLGKGSRRRRHRRSARGSAGSRRLLHAAHNSAVAIRNRARSDMKKAARGRPFPVRTDLLRTARGGGAGGSAAAESAAEQPVGGTDGRAARRAGGVTTTGGAGAGSRRAAVVTCRLFLLVQAANEIAAIIDTHTNAFFILVPLATGPTLRIIEGPSLCRAPAFEGRELLEHSCA